MFDLFVPWPTRFVVPEPKITAYLLNASSKDGASKARYLISYGFDPDDPDTLRRALVGHARRSHFCGNRVADVGLKYLFDGPLPAPNGRDAALRTV